MLPGASACSVCNERDHKSSKCPSLHSPLTPGFYTGGGGGGGHSHDDDDDESTDKSARSALALPDPEKAKKSTTLTIQPQSFFTTYSTRYSTRTPAYTW